MMKMGKPPVKISKLAINQTIFRDFKKTMVTQSKNQNSFTNRKWRNGLIGF